MLWTRTRKAVTALAIFVASFVPFVGYYLGLWDRWFAKPELSLTALEPGPVIEFDPKGKTLSFDLSFTIENSGKASETITAIGGAVDGSGGPLIHFSSADADCSVNGVRLVGVAPNAPPESVRCRMKQAFTNATAGKLTSPGPVTLTVTLRGRNKSYEVRYCISRTDDFWADLLASRTKASRTILNPRDCS